MLYHFLVPLSDTIQFFNIFRYLTFRTGGAIMTALYERERTGIGRVVEVSMQDAMFNFMRSALMGHYLTGAVLMGFGAVLGYLPKLLKPNYRAAFGHNPLGAAAGEQQGEPGEAGIGLGVTRDQPGNQRIGKAAVRSDRIDVRRAALSHRKGAPRPGLSLRGCPCRTIRRGARRRIAGPRRSRAPTAPSC